VTATVGTPDHNKQLPLAFASYEPHHGQGPDGSTVRSKDTKYDARHIKSQTRRDPQRYDTNSTAAPPHHQSGTSACGVSALWRTLTVTIVMLLDVPDLPDLLGTGCARSSWSVSDLTPSVKPAPWVVAAAAL